MAQPELHQTSSVPTQTLTTAAGALWTSVREVIALWHGRARQRSELARLEPWQLRDMGIARSEAASEANKPFWRA